VTPEKAFEEMRPRVESVDQSLVKQPVYKVEDRVIEAQRLYKVAEARRGAFEKLASVELFDLLNIDKLDTMALAVRHAESSWIIMRNPTRSEEFVEKLKLVEEMRAGLLRDLDYVAVRFAPEGLARTLGVVREGTSRQDMLQDVETLVTLARRHKDELSRIGFEQGAADQASNLASEVGRILSPDNADMNNAKDTRNRASTLLERMMAEVRSAAAFLFRHEPDTIADFRDRGR
jgi:hypothetical protein